MHFHVRPAVAGDAVELARLEDAARLALVDVRGGAALLAEQPAIGAPDDWEEALGSGSCAVWVAVVGDVPVGYLHLVLPDRPGGTGHVRQVYVDPEARELGFGDELLAVALDAIVAAGGSTVESFALPGDRDTKNLFERAGVTARKLIVSRRLDGISPRSAQDL